MMNCFTDENMHAVHSARKEQGAQQAKSIP